MGNVRIDTELSNYRKFLYQNGIFENNDDFKQGSSIPNEYNIVFLNGG
jgi:folate-binding Fe-S cluster repair protein YgfZ